MDVVKEAESIIRSKSLQEQFREKLSAFRPGDKVRMWFKMASPLPQSDLDQLATSIAGIYPGAVVEETLTKPSKLELTFSIPRNVSGEWWLALAVIIPVAVILGMVAWGITSLLTSISKNIIPIAVIGGLTLVTIIVLKHQKHPATP